LIVWADEDLTEDGLHADFKLSASGESVILSKADGTTVDSIDYTNQIANISYARNPNGTGNFVTQAPTFNGNNQTLSISEVDYDSSSIAVYPNPSSSNINIISTVTLGTIEIYNLMGQKVFMQNETSNQVNLNVAHLPSGNYLLKCFSDGKTSTSRFVKM
jgi:hypothetical protein